MNQFLSASFSYPAIVFTTLLAIAIGYWLLTLIGVVGFDSLDFDADVDVDADVDADGDMAAAGFFQNKPIRVIPLSLALTLFFFFGWIICHSTALYLGAALSSVLPKFVWGTLVLVFGSLIALIFANMAAMPIAPVFETHVSPRKRDLLGKTVEVRTGRVDEKFGTGSFEDGGAGLIVEIRCASGKLSRGDQALVIDYDPKGEFYLVEPLSEVLKG